MKFMSGNLDEPSYFLDSNIWLYALIKSQDYRKHTIASSLVKSESISISTQVINEVCINLMRKAAFSEQQVH
jgi:predicted nucleic acid-binding protein